jgi:hypothetical protein
MFKFNETKALNILKSKVNSLESKFEESLFLKRLKRQETSSKTLTCIDVVSEFLAPVWSCRLRESFKFVILVY